MGVATSVCRGGPISVLYRNVVLPPTIIHGNESMGREGDMRPGVSRLVLGPFVPQCNADNLFKDCLSPFATLVDKRPGQGRSCRRLLREPPRACTSTSVRASWSAART